MGKTEVTDKHPPTPKQNEKKKVHLSIKKGSRRTQKKKDSQKWPAQKAQFKNAGEHSSERPLLQNWATEEKSVRRKFRTKLIVYRPRETPIYQGLSQQRVRSVPAGDRTGGEEKRTTTHNFSQSRSQIVLYKPEKGQKGTAGTGRQKARGTEDSRVEAERKKQKLF